MTRSKCVSPHSCWRTPNQVVDSVEIAFLLQRTEQACSSSGRLLQSRWQCKPELCCGWKLTGHRDKRYLQTHCLRRWSYSAKRHYLNPAEDMRHIRVSLAKPCLPVLLDGEITPGGFIAIHECLFANLSMELLLKETKNGATKTKLRRKTYSADYEIMKL